MTSDEKKCSLSSLLSMSCRQHVEAFADQLRSRLTSLDSEETNESSWLSINKQEVALSQPKHSTEYDFNTNFLVNIISPNNEINDTEAEYINKDNLVSVKETIPQKNDATLQHPQHEDSDSSDGPFYDCHGDLNKITRNVESENVPNFNSLIKLESNLVDKVNHTRLCEEIDPSDVINHHVSKFSDAINSEEVLPIAEKNYLKPDNNFFNDLYKDDERDEKIPRVRRSSSLKTGKTPPDTPGQKKIVRFADVLGLDLADIRTFLDEIPKIPNSAFDDLSNENIETPSSNSLIDPEPIFEKILVPLFQQPGGQADFIDRVREYQVCLDSAVIEDPVTLSIKGIVRVKNLDFHKTVHVRYSLDSWQNFADVQAVYVENSCDGFSDKFSFILFANSLPIGQKLQFAVRFQCKGCQFWDNNNGVNYCFQCLKPKNTFVTSTPLTNSNNWTSTFY